MTGGPRTAFETFKRDKTLQNLQKTYCHGTPASIRLAFAMWSWQFKWYGPKGGEHREVLSRRNWMPHDQPIVCPQCGFVFSFVGCNDFHLNPKDCKASEWVDIKDGKAFPVTCIMPRSG